MTHILIAEDHPICAAMVTQAVRSRDKYAMISEVASLQETLSHLKHSDVDLLVLDLVLADSSGMSTLACVRVERPEVPVVIFSGSDDRRVTRQAYILGARAVISKAASVAALTSTIFAVLNGDEPDREFLSEDEAAPLFDGPLRILPSLLRGSSNREIAQELGLSEATVKRHLVVIYRALGVNSRSQAMVELQSR